MRKLKWFIVNILWLACVIAATVYSVQGAQYIVSFFTIFLFVFALFSFFPEIKVELEKNDYACNANIEILYDLFITCILVWHGMFIIGGLYLVGNLLTIAAKTKED